MSVDASSIEKLERFISAELGSRGHPGSSASVIAGDELVWAKGFGYSDVENGVQASPETVYGCASVSKTVVTFGFLHLMERGKFSLDDPVNDHLDAKIRTEFEEEPVIRDLLTHYTGMPTRVPPLFHNRKEALTIKAFIEEAARTVRPPRTTWAYCNTGYSIVGHLMELFTGMSYDEYVKRNILEPLEMNSSDFDHTPVVMEKLARGYKRAGGPDKPLIPNEPYVLGSLPQDPAGSLYSTVLDLANFVVANLNGGAFKGRRILREETVEEMHRLQMSPGESRSGMALTWFRNIHDGRVMLSHTGGLPDYTNHVALYPEAGIGVCWLSNLQDGSGWRPPAPTALRILAGDDAPFNSKRVQTVPENWRSLIGIYGDETSQLHVRVQNGYLMLGDLYLERVDESRYTVHGLRNDGYELTFEYDETGKAKQLDLGTSFFGRYVAEETEIDAEADLIGAWMGEFHNSYGFHTLKLEIGDSGKASLMDEKGKVIEIVGFTAESGVVKGSGVFEIPPEYARWGLLQEVEVNFELKATDGQLKGLLRSPGGAIPITFERAQ